MEAPRGIVLKSVHGIPEPVYPPGIDLAKEARIARTRFYPVTILYTVYFVTILSLALRRSVWTTLVSLAIGVVIWSGTEYMVHRYMLHGRFPDGPGFWKHKLHRLFDTMHGDHHQRPWDGMYINGFLETLPIAIVLGSLSFSFPLPTAPVAVATMLFGYIFGEWVHYSVHFHPSRWLYLDYIRRHHLYHHSPHGKDVAFGLSNGVWDVLVRTTRIPAPDRVRLYGHTGIWPLSHARRDERRSA